MIINMLGGATPPEGGTVAINTLVWNTNPANAASAYVNLTGSVKGYWPDSTAFTKEKFLQEASIAQPSISVSNTGLVTATAKATDLINNLASSTAYTDGTLRLVRMPSTYPDQMYQITKQTAIYATPGYNTQTWSTSGKFMTGDVQVAGDVDLVSSNIKSGVNIFGVTGTYGGGTLSFKTTLVPTRYASYLRVSKSDVDSYSGKLLVFYITTFVDATEYSAGNKVVISGACGIGSSSGRMTYGDARGNDTYVYGNGSCSVSTSGSYYDIDVASAYSFSSYETYRVDVWG